jgi:very-short-patch-repair endonuclease
MLSNKSPYKKGGMFEGASHLLFEKAKQLRNNMTGTEEVLWMHLRTGINGFKFRRQHPNIEIHKQVETVLNKISELLNNIIKTKAPKYGV